MINKLTLAEKFKLIIKSSKDYKSILIIGLLFMFIGVVLIYIGLQNHITTLLILGVFFILFMLFFLGFTIPSTVSYYYNKELIKKFGINADAVLKDKEVIDNSYFERIRFTNSISRKGKLIKEINYLIIYTYNFKNILHEGSDIIDKNTFEKIKDRR